MAIRIDRLLIEERWKRVLKSAQIETVQQLFHWTELELVELLDASLPDVRRLCVLAASAILDPPTTAFELLQSTTAHQGIPLAPDIPCFRLRYGLSEFVGPTSSGKSQCCLTLAFLVAAPEYAGGLGSGVVYIDTEGSFQPQRLIEIARARCPLIDTEGVSVGDEQAGVRGSSVVSNDVEAMLSRVHVFRDRTVQDVRQRLATLDDLLIEQNVKLIILDSIAGPCRVAFNQHTGGLQERQEFVTHVANTFKYWSEKLMIPCVATNQVTSRFDMSSSLVASLGVGWAHAINTRFVLDRVDVDTRRIRIVKSPMHPFTAHAYTIDERGMAIDGVALSEDGEGQQQRRGESSGTSRTSGNVFDIAISSLPSIGSVVPSSASSSSEALAAAPLFAHVLDELDDGAFGSIV